MQSEFRDAIKRLMEKVPRGDVDAAATQGNTAVVERELVEWAAKVGAFMCACAWAETSLALPVKDTSIHIKCFACVCVFLVSPTFVRPTRNSAKGLVIDFRVST